MVDVSSGPERDTRGIKTPLLSEEISSIAEESGGDPSLLIDTFCAVSNCPVRMNNADPMTIDKFVSILPITEWGIVLFMV